MTVRRDPFSAPGAWFDACEDYGWGSAASLCGKSESTLRSWAVPDGSGPPRWAIEKLDEALHARHRPKINIQAMDARTGGEPPTVLVLLADAERTLKLSLRMLDGPAMQAEGQFLDMMAAAQMVRDALSDVQQHALIRRRRYLDEFQAKQKEAAADRPRFPERAALRSVGGRE
jgi:hypothetical protein